MKSEGINFPLYRKYKNNKSYFKIVSPQVFEEIQLIGNKKVFRQTEAKLYPEKMFVMDLISNFSEMADEITEAEYLEKLNQ